MSIKKTFSMVSTLPPITGISPYTVNLLSALDKLTTGEIFAFRKIYPEFLYPGELYDLTMKIPEWKNIEHCSVIDWYDPLSWVKPVRLMNSPLLHLQWWSPPTGPIYYFMMKIARNRKKKIILTVHNILPHESNIFFKLLWDRILKLADGYIVHASVNKEELINLYPFTEDKPVWVIPHGVKKMKKISSHKARNILKIPEDKIVFLFFGTIREYKGLDILLRAFADVKGKAFLVIAGKPWVDFSPYNRIIEEKNLSGSVKLDLRLIPEEDVKYFFSAADAVVLPYRYFSSQSGVGSYALGFSVPIIVSNREGLKDFAYEEAVFEGDEKSLSLLLKRFIEDNNFRKSLLKDAEMKREKFSYNEAAVKTLDVYNEIIKT